MKRSMVFFISQLVSLTVFAKTELYRVPVIPPASSWVALHVPYTFGTHDGEVKLLSGSIKINTEDLKKTEGEFSVPITSLTTKKEERDCHMMEALGLDYGESDFPETHVCTESNNLPTSGKNAVKYPTITLKIYSLRPLDNAGPLSEGAQKVDVDGEWTVHGKSYRWTFPLTIAKEGEDVRIKGEVPFSLKNHDIIVKPAKVLFMDISVSDNVKVEFNLLLEKAPSA